MCNLIKSVSHPRTNRGAFYNFSRAILCLTFAFCVVAARGATINAASPASSDVAAAIVSATDGDTVQIPAGTATWVSALSVTKAITIAGAGTNSTILNGGTFFSLKPGKDKLTRITGIQFVEADWTPSYLINCIGGCKQFRIDHCKFVKGTHVLNFNPPGTGASGSAYGVIDHNTFFDCNCAIFVADVEAGEFDWGSSAWSRVPLVPGTTNTVCIEDNVFLTDSLIGNALNNNNQMLYGWCGGRATFRNNIQIDTGSDDALCIDAHGAYTPAEGERGTLMFEVYSNRFSVNAGYGYFFLRGGMHIFFNNTVFLTNGSQSTLIQLADERANPTRDYITNSYFWNNTLNGSQWTGPLALRSGFASSSIVYNQSYFMQAPQPGQNFYPYVPLIYPHPLVSGVSGGSPTNPVASVSPGSLNFGTVRVGSSSNLTLTVRNAGGGTLSGSASVASPFSIVSGATYSLASNASQVVTIRYAPTQTGNNSQTASFTGGGGAIAAVSGSAWTVLPGLTFAANAGIISQPFVVNADTTISQSTTTTDPTTAGRAVYWFNIPTAGNYSVIVNVLAPDDSANSLFVNIDAQPVSPANVWGIPTNSIFLSQPVMLNGSTTPQVWNLSAGLHQLIILGREAGVVIGQISIVSSSGQTKPASPSNFRIIATGL